MLKPNEWRCLCGGVSRAEEDCRKCGEPETCPGTSRSDSAGVPARRVFDAVRMNHVASPRGTSEVPGLALGMVYFI